MGLCKCPKRQVTNQFCFEHRVNVCEHCMVTSHPKCIVQSYLQWLKDSDYVSSCGLCGDALEAGDCVRLICYHVFHWHCLHERENSLPANTAPGGHLCPSCNDPIFPPSNLISPVADILRNRLAQVNWGRNELGLPLLSEQTKLPKSEMTSAVNNIAGLSYHNKQNNSMTVKTHSVLHIEPASTSSTDFQASSRRALLPREPPIGQSDRDDNKYKRRTPSEVFSRWSRRFYAPSSRPPWRRTWFLVVFGILVFLAIIYLMAHFGRQSADQIQMLDPDYNANLKHDG